MPPTNNLATTERAAEDAIMERWHAEFRTERELDAHGFAGDEDVALLLGDMEDEVTLDDCRRVLVNGRVQYESWYDRSLPRRGAPEVADTPRGDLLDVGALNEGETGDDE